VAVNESQEPAAPEPGPRAGEPVPAPMVPEPPERPRELPTGRVELETVAEGYAVTVDPEDSAETLAEKVRAVRRAIDEVPRHRLVSLLEWAGLPYDAAAASKDRMARKILRAKFRDFAGLEVEDMRALARLRGVEYADVDDAKALARKLDPRGLVSRLWNKVTGRVVGMLLASVPDEEMDEGPEGAGEESLAMKRHIRQKGLMEGVKTYVRSSLDSYLLEKMDEIEERVDTKLEEIDRKMDLWREKEVRYRLRLIKITLVAAVLVALVSLVYESVKEPLHSGLRHLASYLKYLFGL